MPRRRTNYSNLSHLHASEKLRGNRDLVLEAVRNNGLSLAHVSVKLRGNYDIVLESVKNNGLSLTNDSEKLRGNYALRQNIKIILTKNSHEAHTHVSTTFVNTARIIQTTYRQHFSSLFAQKIFRALAFSKRQ